MTKRGKPKKITMNYGEKLKMQNYIYVVCLFVCLLEVRLEFKLMPLRDLLGVKGREILPYYNSESH